MSKLFGATFCVAFLAFVLLVPALQVAAQPVPCGSELNTFIRRTGTNLTAAQGVKGRNMVRDSNRANCTPSPGDHAAEHHSTVHIRAANGLDWIEQGWFTETGVGIRGFSEWGVAGTMVRGYAEWGYNCASNTYLTPGHWARFHLYRYLVTTWVLSYDDDDNGSYCSTTSFTGVTFSSGTPMGETGIHGAATSAYDHFDAMYYATMNGNSGWTLFPGNTWYESCIPGYGRHGIAADEWEIAQGYACP